MASWELLFSLPINPPTLVNEGLSDLAEIVEDWGEISNVPRLFPSLIKYTHIALSACLQSHKCKFNEWTFSYTSSSCHSSARLWKKWKKTEKNPTYMPPNGGSMTPPPQSNLQSPSRPPRVRLGHGGRGRGDLGPAPDADQTDPPNNPRMQSGMLMLYPQPTSRG